MGARRQSNDFPAAMKAGDCSCDESRDSFPMDSALLFQKMDAIVSFGMSQGPQQISLGQSQHTKVKAQHEKATFRRHDAHVKLNVAICAAAQKGAESLLEFAHDNKKDMNLVNLSTVLHRLARMAEHAPLHDCRYTPLLEATRAAIFGSGCQARCLSNVAWAVARLGLNSPEMMHDIAEMSIARLHQFKPYELGILLWSYAKLQLCQTLLFEVAHDHIMVHLSEFGAASIATIVWAFASAKIANSENLIRKAADAFALHLKGEQHAMESETIQSVALENMMWGLATLRVQPQREAIAIIAEAALQHLTTFKVHEFTIVMWAFARLGFFSDELFVQASELVKHSAMLRSKIHPQGLANLLWAFARYTGKDRRCSVIGGMVALFPTCLQMVEYLKPQELACVLESLAVLGKAKGGNEILDRIFLVAAEVGTSTALSDEWSLSSVVKALKAYTDVLGDRLGKAELCSSFMNQLLCICTRFQSQVNAKDLFSIFEALPAAWNPSPQAMEALAIVVLAAAQTTGFRQNLTRLAAISNTSGSILVQVLASHCASHEIVVPAAMRTATDALMKPQELTLALDSPAYVSHCVSQLRPEYLKQAALSTGKDEPAYICLGDPVVGKLMHGGLEDSLANWMANKKKPRRSCSVVSTSVGFSSEASDDQFLISDGELA